MGVTMGMTVVERVSVIGRRLATTSLRRLLLASLTIAAILLGLIGMHALSAGAATQTSHASHSELAPGLSSQMQTMPGSDDPAPLAIASALILSVGVIPVGACTGVCAMNCLLLGMVCALSFLVALIGLLLGKLPSRLFSGIRTVTRVARIVSSRLVQPTTASLTMLSISRT